MKKKILNGLYPSDYEHPFDRKALESLEGTPGLETLVRKSFEYGFEKMFRIQYTGSNLKVNNTNFPELYSTLEEVCNALSLPEKPELYISSQHAINAMAIGVQNPIIVLFSGAIDNLDKDELMFIIGHEIGHIKSNHVLYHQMASILPFIGNILGSATLGIGGLISKGLELALLNWKRMSEFTSDRAGLLACQNVEAATRAMIKIAGLPTKYYYKNLIEDFVKQAREFDDYDYETLNKIAKTLSIMWQSHPWTVMRGSEFYKWIDTGQYEQILNWDARLKEEIVSSDAFYCPNCGTVIRSEGKFCGGCGAKINEKELSLVNETAY